MLLSAWTLLSLHVDGGILLASCARTDRAAIAAYNVVTHDAWQCSLSITSCLRFASSSLCQTTCRSIESQRFERLVVVVVIVLLLLRKVHSYDDIFRWSHSYYYYAAAATLSCISFLAFREA